jgi:2-octaprenylphenol hydroxylase
VNGDRANAFSVVIAGGGIVGLVLAKLLSAGLQKELGQTGHRFKLALVEPDPPAAIDLEAPLDLRVSALAPASRAILKAVGAWDELPRERVCAYDRMCVWQAGGSAGGARSVSFDAAEMGEPELGHIVENRAIRQILWEDLAADKSVELITGSKLAQLEVGESAAVLHLDSGEAVSADLLIGADGARSRVRAQLSLSFKEIPHGQSAIVAHVATELPHAHTAWQCFLEGGPVALLPLADGRSSLVWSCPDSQVEALLQADDREFAAQLRAALANTLGDLTITTPRMSFPLVSGYTSRYIGPRFALVGDAAHRIHPLAGQGVNLGLLDAAVLAETLLEHIVHPCADPGDMRVLRRYERSRKGDNLLTLGMMDALNRLFAGPARQLGGEGLAAVSALRPVKNTFARYAMGQGRELPAAARSFMR